MNILIAGATGLLGEELVKILSKKNTIYYLSRKGILKYENLKYIECDLTNFSTNNFPKSIDAIYYCAQSRNFRDFPNQCLDIFDVNISAPLKIVDWAVKNSVKKFFYVSSGGIYKNQYETINEYFDINANEKNGFYLDSKLSADVLLRNFHEYFETFAILRPFFIYGPKQEQNMFIPRLFNSIKNKKAVFLSEKDGIYINPIYVEDAAYALSKLLNLKGEYVINIAGNDNISLKELILKISKLVKVEPIFEYLKKDSPHLNADISLMKKLLYKPKYSLDDGLLKMLEVSTDV